MDWEPPLEIARGPARKGPWQMNDSTFHYVDDPTVRFGESDDDLGVLWVDNQKQQIFFQRYEGRTPQFGKPTQVSRSPDTFSWLPQMVVSGGEDGSVYVLWQEIVFSGGSHGGEAFFARSTDGGETFEPPINLSSSEAGDGKGRLTAEIWDNGSLDLARGPEGTLYAAWTEYEGRLWLRRSTDGGASFEAPLRVAGNERTPARGPDLAVADNGTVYLAWTVGEHDDGDVHVARSTDRGRSFDEPSTPVETDGHSDAPKLAVDGDGDVHLAYAESPKGLLETYGVRYVQLDGELQATGEPVRPAAPLDGDVAQTHFPEIGIDDRGVVYLIWERYSRTDSAPYGLGVARSREDVGAFSSGIVPGTEDLALGFNGSLQGQLMQKLAVSPSGRLAVVNSRFDEGASSRIRLFRASGRGEE